MEAKNKPTLRKVKRKKIRTMEWEHKIDKTSYKQNCGLKRECSKGKRTTLAPEPNRNALDRLVRAPDGRWRAGKRELLRKGLWRGLEREGGGIENAGAMLKKGGSKRWGGNRKLERNRVENEEGEMANWVVREYITGNEK